MDLVSGKIKRRYFSPIFMRRVLFSFLLLALSGCGLDETLQRSDKALSLEEASKDATVSSLPFPPSTTDVYYVYHAGGMQEWEFFVRFTVDSNDLDKAVNDLLSNRDKTINEHHFYTFKPIADAPASPEESFLSPMPWWNPGSITNGYYRDSTNGQPCQIWADVTHHTIYLSETD